METLRDFATDGLVVREYELGEHDKMLTLLTPSYGRISVIAKGARSLKNKYMSPARLFTYANYELHRRGDMMWLRSAEVIESSLYAVCRGIKDQRLIKGTFEWRAAGYSGYMPELGDCHICGAPDAACANDGGICYIDVMNGALMCASCAAGRLERDAALPSDVIPVDSDGVRSILLPVNRSVLAAIKYVLTAMPERMFAFSLSEDADLETFSSVGSTYITHHLERGFASLALYNEIRNM